MADNTQECYVNINTPTEFNNNSQLPDLTDKNGAEITTAMWGISSAVIKEIGNMNRIYSSKHGLFASVPIKSNTFNLASYNSSALYVSRPHI